MSSWKYFCLRISLLIEFQNWCGVSNIGHHFRKKSYLKIDVIKICHYDRLIYFTLIPKKLIFLYFILSMFCYEFYLIIRRLQNSSKIPVKFQQEFCSWKQKASYTVHPKIASFSTWGRVLVHDSVTRWHEVTEMTTPIKD